ncbi:MAG: type II toxin-antitoxin system PemK/MazF family toxin [Candidatus Dormibacteria bacterium]
MGRDEGPWTALVRDIRAAVDRAVSRRASGPRRSTNGATPWFDGRPAARPNRGEVWLLGRDAARQEPVVVLQPPDQQGDTLLVAPLTRPTSVGPGTIALAAGDGLPVASVARLDRLHAVDAATLVRAVGRLRDDTLARADEVLAATLGLRTPGAVRDIDRSSVLLQQVEAASLSPPPPPPPAAGTGRLEDHPITQLFGQSPAPAMTSFGAPGHGSSEVRVSDVLPDLQHLVRQRLHSSATRLESILDEGVTGGRSVSWAADAVRTTSIRGVLQSSVDSIADEMEAIAAAHRDSR